MDIKDIKFKIKPYLNVRTLKSIGRRARFLLNAPLLVGIFLIICAGLGIVYMQHQREQDDLNSQIEITSAALQGQPQDINALEDERDQKTSELEDLVASFPGDAVDTEIMAAVLQIAVDNSINITQWEVGPATKRNIGTNSYLAYPFSITAEGELDNLLNVVETLESKPEVLMTLVFESATIKLPDEETPASASLDFAIYVHT